MSVLHDGTATNKTIEVVYFVTELELVCSGRRAAGGRRVIRDISAHIKSSGKLQSGIKSVRSDFGSAAVRLRRGRGFTAASNPLDGRLMHSWGLLSPHQHIRIKLH